MRKLIALAFTLLLGHAADADVRVSLGIDIPGISIGINVPRYPDLVLIPGYPVYYEPRGRSNYFFYDGLYWVLVDDRWYVSSWYDGPWDYVDPYDVPLFLLRVPVRYYLLPPPYFHGWYRDAPPRWQEHWGREWERRRGRDWNLWDRHHGPEPAPLPHYQRDFYGRGYPVDPRQQHRIHDERYRYAPRDRTSRDHDTRWREARPDAVGRTGERDNHDRRVPSTAPNEPTTARTQQPEHQRDLDTQTDRDRQGDRDRYRTRERARAPDNTDRNVNNPPRELDRHANERRVLDRPQSGQGATPAREPERRDAEHRVPAGGMPERRERHGEPPREPQLERAAPRPPERPPASGESAPPPAPIPNRHAPPEDAAERHRGGPSGSHRHDEP